MCRRTRKNNIQLLYKLLNPANAELNPICHFLALLGAHHILHISRIRVKIWRFWPVPFVSRLRFIPGHRVLWLKTLVKVKVKFTLEQAFVACCLRGLLSFVICPNKLRKSTSNFVTILTFHIYFNTYINIQWCISQTQHNFIMFIIVLGQHVSILKESSSGPSKKQILT
jgi:hypothetical protein